MNAGIANHFLYSNKSVEIVVISYFSSLQISCRGIKHQPTVCDVRADMLSFKKELNGVSSLGTRASHYWKMEFYHVLNLEFPPEAHTFEHLVPSGGAVMKGLGGGGLLGEVSHWGWASLPVCFLTTGAM